MNSRFRELQREVEFRRCARDPHYWFENYVFIKHPSKGKTLIQLREAQSDTLRAFLDEDRVIILKARQIGFSTLCAGYALWRVLFHRDENIIMLSKTERDAVDLLSKSYYMYRNLPLWMTARGPKLRSNHQQKMVFDNDSQIESLPSRTNPARGRTVTLVIVDEWAFLENPEEAWASIEPIADLGGRIVGLSTANGAGNFFHTFWVNATTGASGFKPIFYPWSAVPERGEDWFRLKEEEMLPWQLHQEYPRSAEEAFIKSGNPYFDMDMILSLERERMTAPRATGYLVELTSLRDFEFRAGTRGPLRVWDYPRQDHAYVIGADVAEGLEYGDYSSAFVLDLTDGRVCAEYHAHVEADIFGRELAKLGWYYNTALVGVESNNHGLTTLVAIRDQAYKRLYYRVQYDERTRVQGRKMGWRTSRVTKPLMLDELGLALRENGIRLFSDKAYAELKTFVRDEKGQAHGSPHDDRVIALAIANQMRKHATAPEHRTEQSDYWTLNWFDRQIDIANSPTGDFIGAYNALPGRPGWN